MITNKSRLKFNSEKWHNYNAVTKTLQTEYNYMSTDYNNCSIID